MGLFYQLSRSSNDIQIPHLTLNFARYILDLLAPALCTMAYLARIDHLPTTSSNDKRLRLPYRTKARPRNSQNGRQRKTTSLSNCEARG